MHLSLARDLTERVGHAAFLADRRPNSFIAALDGVGDCARRLIELRGDDADPLRIQGRLLASQLGVARAAYLRLHRPALLGAISEMGRIAGRVAAMEVLIPLMPPEAMLVEPGVKVTFPPGDRRVTRRAEPAGVIRKFLRVVRRDGQPDTGVPLELIQGGRA